jgi:hypothetical protein
MARLFLYMHGLIALALCAIPAAQAAEGCAQGREIRADLEEWKAEVAKKSISQARLGELFSQMHLKTGFARELPDVEQPGVNARSISIDGVDELKAKLSGRSSPEHVIVVKYELKVGRSCGEHEDHCFEGYGIQVLRPVGKNAWCSFGTDLSAEIWGPDRDFKFCQEAKSPARDFAFFALTRNGRKVIQLDDYRAHCPSTGTRSSNHERSYWEIQEGSLAEIFKVTLHSQSGGPDFGKKSTLKGRLTFSGDFPKLIHFEAQEEDCGADAFSEDPRKARAACKKNERFQVYHYGEGRYAPEAPPRK